MDGLTQTDIIAAIDWMQRLAAMNALAVPQITIRGTENGHLWALISDDTVPRYALSREDGIYLLECVASDQSRSVICEGLEIEDVFTEAPQATIPPF